MARPAVQHLHVHVAASADSESFEEIVHQLRLQVADAPDLHLQVDDRVRPSSEIDRRDRERLVHRHDEIAGAVDPAAVAERLGDRFAERDADVLDRMVLIDVEIAARSDLQIERAVAREELEHMIEKADTGTHVVTAFAFERQRQPDLGFSRAPIDYRAAHSTSSIAAMQRFV